MPQDSLNFNSISLRLQHLFSDHVGCQSFPAACSLDAVADELAEGPSRPTERRSLL